MHACVTHYELITSEYMEKIKQKQLELRHICSTERFNYLIGKNDHFVKKIKMKLQTTKSKKLNKLIHQQNPSSQATKDKQIWIKSLGLTNSDKQNLSENLSLDDSVIFSALQLLKRQYPLLIIQPPSLIYSCFEYCPFETIQILHNGNHHWILVTSFNGDITIYDSLNTNPTSSIIKQLSQLFSPDDTVPSYKTSPCHQQIGSTDCGLFSIAYAVDLLLGNNPSNIIYDQSKMRVHLLNCLETELITPFPKYKQNISSQLPSQNQTGEWKKPRRSARIKNKTAHTAVKTITSENRFATLCENALVKTNSKSDTITETSDKHYTSSTPEKKSNTSSIIFNLSTSKLTSTETSVLEKGLNFCPSTKHLDKKALIDDTFSFCRKMRMKEFFHDQNTNNSEQSFSQNKNTQEQQKLKESSERIDMTSKMKNPYYQPPHCQSKNLELYLSNIKNSITQLIKSPKSMTPNMTNDEHIALANLKSRSDIIIHSADKGGKIVIMDKSDYILECQTQLNDTNFYKPLQNDPTNHLKDVITDEINNMHDQKIISENEYKYLNEDLQKPRTPVFYGLPKIHKVFKKIPPMRPIISGFKSCTARLSEYIDSFLKYQARKCKSYIKDTNEFLIKLRSLKSIPINSIMVTMDVTSLYTNIDHEEGAQACFEKLETRQNKHVSSTLLKKLILLVLKSNIFKFGTAFYQQIKGTAMGTPMAPNYANLFMDKFETNILKSYYKKTGIRPLIWVRFIDDIFFIWTEGEQSLNEFIEFAQSFSTTTSMKSNIKFEVHQSTDRVNFLDVSVLLQNGIITTTIYSKPTDSHLYLNVNSSHPEHVIKNIPKSQFLRLRRICSDSCDFMTKCNTFINYFINQGYNKDHLIHQAKSIQLMKQEDLLVTKTNTKNNETPIFVTTWHPTLKSLPAILRQSHHHLENDSKLSKIFKEKPIVAFKRKKTIGNHVVRSDILKAKKTVTSCSPCKNCKKMCHLINTYAAVTNVNNGRSTYLECNSNCTTREVIYAARCKVHNLIYIGHTGDELRTRFSKHRYDAKARPGNNELTAHIFEHKHDFEKDIDVTILKDKLFTKAEREYHEDRFICLLGTKQPHGLNIDVNQFASEMYDYAQHLLD